MTAANIDDLKPGMILVKPVHNHQGRLLLDAGAKLTKKHIRILKSWGVNESFVKGDLDVLEADPETPAADVEDSFEAALREKFSDVLDDPVMVEIFRVARKQLKKQEPSR